MTLQEFAMHSGCMDLREELLNKLTQANTDYATEEAVGGGDPLALQYLEGRIRILEEILELVQ